ncbi:MAG: hypothetical protein D6734_08470 [Candidatus Schekmanbacteria bacterium]|nr:MAG: hypothetical protein D6734_08470 [Candidatus Schekmanbacteria bacterium]
MKASFYGLLLYILLFVFKPADHIPSLKPFRLALVVSILVLLFVIISGRFKLSKGLIPYLMFVYFVLSFFSLINSSYTQFSNISIVFLLKPVILFYLICCVLDNEEKIMKFIKVFTFAIFIDLFISILIFRSGQLGYRLISFFQGIGADTNEYGMHILMIIPFLVYFIETEKNLPKKLFYIFFILLSGYAMVRTYSRGSTLSAGVLFLMFGWIRRKDKKFIFAMVIILICILLVTPQKFWNRLSTITADPTRADGSINARIAALKHGLELIKENLFFGIGFGAFRFASMRVVAFGEDTSHIAHNTYLEIAVETGIINLIVFLLIIILAIRTCLSNMKKLSHYEGSIDLKNMNQALLMSLIVFCICVIFLSMRFDRFFYIVLALILCIQDRAIELEKKNEERELSKL